MTLSSLPKTFPFILGSVESARPPPQADANLHVICRMNRQRFFVVLCEAIAKKRAAPAPPAAYENFLLPCPNEQRRGSLLASKRPLVQRQTDGHTGHAGKYSNGVRHNIRPRPPALSSPRASDVSIDRTATLEVPYSILPPRRSMACSYGR